MPPKRKAAEVSGEKSKSLAPQPKKSKFAIPPKDFLDSATSLHAVLSGDSELTKVECKPKKFGSSSLGWNGNTRVKVPIKVRDGEAHEYDAQVTFNITLIGSKETAAANEDKDEAEPEAADADHTEAQGEENKGEDKAE